MLSFSQCLNQLTLCSIWLLVPLLLIVADCGVGAAIGLLPPSMPSPCDYGADKPEKIRRLTGDDDAMDAGRPTTAPSSSHLHIAVKRSASGSLLGRLHNRSSKADCAGRRRVIDAMDRSIDRTNRIK